MGGKRLGITGFVTIDAILAAGQQVTPKPSRGRRRRGRKQGGALAAKFGLNPAHLGRGGETFTKSKIAPAEASANKENAAPAETAPAETGRLVHAETDRVGIMPGTR